MDSGTNTEFFFVCVCVCGGGVFDKWVGVSNQGTDYVQDNSTECRIFVILIGKISAFFYSLGRRKCSEYNYKYQCEMHRVCMNCFLLKIQYWINKYTRYIEDLVYKDMQHGFESLDSPFKIHANNQADFQSTFILEDVYISPCTHGTTDCQKPMVFFLKQKAGSRVWYDNTDSTRCSMSGQVLFLSVADRKKKREEKIVIPMSDGMYRRHVQPLIRSVILGRHLARRIWDTGNSV